jgi:anti-anti-sigma factor
MANVVTDQRRGLSETLFEIDVLDRQTPSSWLRAVGVLDRHGGEMLEALLIAQQESGMRYVRVDLSGVTAIDSVGLITLLNAHRRFLAARGTLVLTGVGAALFGVLASAQLDRVLLTVEPFATSGESACRRAGLAAR